MEAPVCVPDLLRARSTEAPDLVALGVVGRGVDGAETLTYGEWEARSNAVARGLVARRVRTGDRVALLFDNDRWTDYAVCYLGVHKAGAAAVPVSQRFAPAELAHVLEHSEITGLIHTPDIVPPVGPGWRARYETLADGRSTSPFQQPVGAESLAEILYTSGTTGAPKGVACSHGSILVYDLPAGASQARPSSVLMLHAFPIGTNAGQECLRMPLRRPGNAAVVLAVFDPHRLCAAVEERGVTRLQLVPAMAQMVVSSGAADRHDVSSVERLTLSSAPAPPALFPRVAAAFPNASVWNAYALTESGGARTLMRYDERKPGSVGRAVGSSEIRVVDDQAEELLPGATGEVWLRRRGAPRREYFRDPASTAAAFAGDWLRTGDIGFLDEDGFLYLVDRQKDVIISGGFNVASVEVENALYEHAEVSEAAVFGIPHPVLGQVVAAAVVVRSPLGARELQASVRDRLGEHKVPRHVFFLEALPRNASGKVVKSELRDRFRAEARRVAGVGPRDEVEATITLIWRAVLEVDEIGVHDDFFDLGGHSLSAAQVVARLQDAFVVTVPVAVLFERPTVAELAEAVRAAGMSAAAVGTD